MKCIECILGIYALHTMEVEKNVYCVLHCSIVEYLARDMKAIRVKRIYVRT